MAGHPELLGCHEHYLNALSTGLVAYDVAAGQRCVDTIAQHGGCDSQAQAAIVEACATGRLLGGAVAPGAPCAEDIDCRPSTYADGGEAPEVCDIDPTQLATCAQSCRLSARAVGEDCDLNGGSSRFCGNGRCSVSGHPGNTGICVGYVATGANCTFDHCDPADAYCLVHYSPDGGPRTDTCTPRGGPGAACSEALCFDQADPFCGCVRGLVCATSSASPTVPICRAPDALGAACDSLSSESTCAPGLTCSRSNVCVKVHSALGEPCDPNDGVFCAPGLYCLNDLQASCVPEALLGEPCDSGDGCAPGLRCNYTFPPDGGFVTACAPLAGQGEGCLGGYCQDLLVCTDYSADGGRSCQPILGLGDGCADFTQYCSEGTCDVVAAALVCVPRQPQGGPCYWGGDCEWFECQPPTDGGFEGACGPACSTSPF